MTTQLTSRPAQPLQGLGWWNIYFILKIALFLQGTIDFHPLENFALVVFLLLPLKARALHVLRLVIAIPAAAWLMHDDSYLPPLDRLWAQAGQLMQFEGSYLLELLGRFISFQTLLALFAVVAGYILLDRVFRVSVIVVAALVFISLPSANVPTAVAQPERQTVSEKTVTSVTSPAGTDDASLNTYLSGFFNTEAKRQVLFDSPAQNEVPFDLLLLSLCSVAWDDIEIAGLSDHPLFKEFDVLFDQYNSATSYSGPAVIRLLRASCGQETHSQLFSGAPSQQCYLFDNLKKLGFEENLVMNHDGVFDNFLQLIKTDGQVSADLMPQQGFTPYQKAFDGKPIYRDRQVLEDWFTHRQADHSEKVVTLYNTISLHDGNRMIRGDASTSMASYKARLQHLLDDLYAFFHTLKQSERNIVVVMIPEHGAGMKGDRMQISGMREIPSESITHIPVGLKIFGKDIVRTGEPVHVTAPASHLALSQLISNVLAQNPYQTGRFDPASLIKNLPETPRVSQNEGSTVIDVNGKPYVSLDGNSWSAYPAH
ncbi:cellulose biosynthesis protein BcsG [Photobacterium galatheae]|uniref:Membrane protein n=1 Tax=Photobacterium galatheae TaxID=1654360 RepID=A0A066RI53_9GAMM|nr:cellulose biosynthesis protein BcsG [Photobacterium galatheae]KDM90004.1 membrane protein [Photobacterium galatheae]MCM0149985.1 cellulose biosynthesis protein BcsG [Photobacterium galatheae]